MPPSRTAQARSSKAANSRPSGSDTEPDSDQEQETPRPHKTLKKRVSDVYDASFTSESGRVPFKSVNINDDAAEKRLRRKSTKQLIAPDNAEAGRSSEANMDEGRAAAQAKQKQQLQTIAQAPAPQVSYDVMSSNFEEWMKMATDNKINAANSWNFALIDYFHDMSLLRNNNDNSINFQRASCTLDGCVKIWTSRVDSVGTETGKLLSNLANEGRDDEDGGDSDNPDGEPSQEKRKRKAHRSESTLAKNPAQLRSKKPGERETEFNVDPLFRKTCADFDEGGAQGLLMNHLSLGVGKDGSLRVVFDAGDSRSKDDEEEEPLEEPLDSVNLTELREKFLPSLDALDSKAISHSLEGFSFVKDAFSFDEALLLRENPRVDFDDDDDDEPVPFQDDIGDAPMDVDGAEPGTEDFFVGDQAAGDEYVNDDFGGNHDEDGEDNRSESAGAAHAGPPGAFVPFDPRRVPNERDLVMAMTDTDNQDSIFGYFDPKVMKNWAGPEHWKLRKVVRRPDPTEAAAAKPRREKKAPFKIDFLTAPSKTSAEISKELFAPPANKSKLTLPEASTSKKGGRGRKTKEKRSDQTLPDDMHFSSRQLVTLFLKPKFSLKMRGHRNRLDDRGDGEIDENFWAQAAADQAAGQGEEGDDTGEGGAIPFNTQFFHEDFEDAPGFDDVYDNDGVDPSSVDAGEQDLLAATQGQKRRVRPEYVNYAKRAKRVDVRRLKENIWTNLDIVVSHKKEDEDDVDMDRDNRPATDPSEARVFNSVISGLEKSYPPDKMEEISTSFCFICLLHLANEQGLKIETGEESSEPDPAAAEDRPVGNIWDLKIYRDPNATPAA